MNNTWDRLFIGIMSFGYLVAAGILILVALGWSVPVTTVQNYLLYTSNRWVLGLTGAFVFIVMLTLFLSSFKTPPVLQAAIHETPLGQIKITLPALEHLVLKSAKSVYGVRDIRPQIKNLGEGLGLYLKVQVLPDVNIPNVTADLQKTLKDYLLKTAGIAVQEIKIQVNKVSWENKSRVE